MGTTWIIGVGLLKLAKKSYGRKHRVSMKATNSCIKVLTHARHVFLTRIFWTTFAPSITFCLIWRKFPQRQQCLPFLLNWAKFASCVRWTHNQNTLGFELLQNQGIKQWHWESIEWLCSHEMALDMWEARVDQLEHGIGKGFLQFFFVFGLFCDLR